MTSTNSQLFLNELNNIAASYQGSQTDPTIGTAIGVLINQTLFSGQLGDAINLNLKLNPNNFNQANTTDYTSFLTNVYEKVLGYPANSVPSSSGVFFDPSNSGCPLNGLFNIYTHLMGLNNPNFQDQTILNDTHLAGQFKALFTDFIKNFSFSILSSSNTPQTVKVGAVTYSVSNSNNYNNFIKSFLYYLSSTTVIQTANKNAALSFLQPLNTLPNNYIESYQQIYESFNGPIGTLSQSSANWTIAQRVFVQRLSAFYISELRKTATPAQPSGFFDASQDLGDWYNYTQNLYYNPQFSPNVITKNPRSTVILNQVLASLINMIGTVQTVAAAQANSLNFLSQWQQSYTNKLNQIRTFAENDGTVLGGPTQTVGGWNVDAQQQTRSQMNNVNQTYLTKIQANQQSIADNAKSLQSNVNQSSDAANQQGSLADSVLQEMSTILSSIFR